jgi:hypothetical protein
MDLTWLFPINKWNYKSKSALNNLPFEKFEQLCANMAE